MLALQILKAPTQHPGQAGAAEGEAQRTFVIALHENDRRCIIQQAFQAGICRFGLRLLLLQITDIYRVANNLAPGFSQHLTMQTKPEIFPVGPLRTNNLIEPQPQLRSFLQMQAQLLPIKRLDKPKKLLQSYTVICVRLTSQYPQQARCQSDPVTVDVELQPATFQHLLKPGITLQYLLHVLATDDTTQWRRNQHQQGQPISIAEEGQFLPDICPCHNQPGLDARLLAIRHQPDGFGALW